MRKKIPEPLRLKKFRNWLQLLDTHQNKVLTVVLGLGLLLRLLQPSMLLLDPDATGYASPALNFLLQGKFDHVYGRSYVYPLFLLGIWTVFKNLYVVVLVQMGIALVSLLLFYRSMGKWLKLQVSEELIPLFNALLLLLVALMAWDGNLYLYEHCLRPEGLGMASLLLLISIILNFERAESGPEKLLWSWLLVILLVVFSLLHPRFLPGFGIIGLLLAVRIWKEKIQLFLRLLWVIIAMLGIGLVVYPEVYLHRKYDAVGSSFAYRQFVYSQVPAVLDIVEHNTWVVAQFDTAHFMPDMRQVLQEKGGGSPYYRALGYNLDKLQYELSGKELYAFFYEKAVLREQEMFEQPNAKRIKTVSDSAYNAFYKEWTKKIVRERPLALPKKVGRELGYSWFVTYPTYLGFPFHLRYEQSFESNRVEQEQLLKNMGYLPGQKLVLDRPLLMDGFFLMACVPLQFLFLISLFYNAWACLRGKLPLWGKAVLIGVWGYYLTVSLLHTLGFPRYIHSLSPLMYISIFLFILVWLPEKKSWFNNKSLRF